MPRRRKDYRDYSIADRPQTERDCTVRALHIASGADYDMCYLAVALTGRRNNCGARITDWIRAYRKFGLCETKDQINLKHDVFPQDNVIVLIHGHIFAIRNGVHSDGMYWRANNNKRIRLAWRIP